MIRHDGALRSGGGSGPWLGLFMTAVLAVIAVIVGLSASPARVRQPSEVDLAAPQVPAPAAPAPMR
jgi:hypothetical protein